MTYPLYLKGEWQPICRMIRWKIAGYLHFLYVVYYVRDAHYVLYALMFVLEWRGTPDKFLYIVSYIVLQYYCTYLLWRSAVIPLLHYVLTMLCSHGNAPYTHCVMVLCCHGSAPYTQVVSQCRVTVVTLCIHPVSMCRVAMVTLPFLTIHVTLDTCRHSQILLYHPQLTIV